MLKKLVFVTIIFLLFLKIDYRLINDLNCCGDDFDYYSHAETIGIDFDFDYSNQIPNGSRFYFNGKNAPIGFVGSGILSSPFLAIGNILDKIFNDSSTIDLYKNLIYSFSSIVYLLLSLILIRRSIQNFKKNIPNLEIIFFGSGIVYFAFERYSMTHVYEVFSISLLIYTITKYIIENKNLYIFVTPFIMLLCILIRWTNIYIFFIPGILISLTYKNYKETIGFYFNKYFILSSLTSTILFLQLSKLIYGVITFSPSFVYMQKGFAKNTLKNYIINFDINIFKSIRDFLNILISQEFGLFWFSPVLFLGIISIISMILLNRKEMLITKFIILFIFVQNFIIVSIWNSTASSYGYRYLYSLIPISLVTISHETNINSTLKRNYLLYFSIFSIISVLFFESTIQTQLSEANVINSFGSEVRYSQPLYLTGFIKSLINFEAYFKILGTSYLGAILIKLFLFLFGRDKLEIILNFFKITQNQDLVELIYKLELLDIKYFLIVTIFSIFMSYIFLKKVKVNE